MRYSPKKFVLRNITKKSTPHDIKVKDAKMYYRWAEENKIKVKKPINLKEFRQKVNELKTLYDKYHLNEETQSVLNIDVNHKPLYSVKSRKYKYDKKDVMQHVITLDNPLPINFNSMEYIAKYFVNLMLLFSFGTTTIHR